MFIPGHHDMRRHRHGRIDMRQHADLARLQGADGQAEGGGMIQAVEQGGILPARRLQRRRHHMAVGQPGEHCHARREIAAEHGMRPPDHGHGIGRSGGEIG